MPVEEVNAVRLEPSQTALDGNPDVVCLAVEAAIMPPGLRIDIPAELDWFSSEGRYSISVSGTRGSNRGDDRIVYVLSRVPRSVCLMLHARPSGATLDHCKWRDGSPLQGGRPRVIGWRELRPTVQPTDWFQGVALGGSRAEPWPYFRSRLPRAGNGHGVLLASLCPQDKHSERAPPTSAASAGTILA
jgi:hypothetical protein